MMITTKEAAELTGYSAHSLHQWASRGEGGPPYYQRRRKARRMYRRDEVLAWVESLRSDQTDQDDQDDQTAAPAQ